MRSVLDGCGVPRHMDACHAPAPHQILDVPVLHAPEASALPDAADTEAIEPYEIRDQGSEGTCVPHGIYGLAEQLLRRKTGQKIRLSRKWAYDVDRERRNVPLNEDVGMVIADGVKTFTDVGAVDETLWPYSKPLDAQPPSDLEKTAHHKLLLAFRCPDRLSMMASIAQGFGVVFGMSCFESFMGSDVARTGEVRLPGSGEQPTGRHCMIAGAYDCVSMNGLLGYFKVVNSWGTGWGMKGCCCVPFQYIDLYGFDAWTFRLVDVK